MIVVSFKTSVSVRNLCFLVPWKRPFFLFVAQIETDNTAHSHICTLALLPRGESPKNRKVNRLNGSVCIVKHDATTDAVRQDNTRANRRGRFRTGIQGCMKDE